MKADPPELCQQWHRICLRRVSPEDVHFKLPSFLLFTRSVILRSKTSPPLASPSVGWALGVMLRWMGVPKTQRPRMAKRRRGGGDPGKTVTGQHAYLTSLAKKTVGVLCSYWKWWSNTKMRNASWNLIEPKYHWTHSTSHPLSIDPAPASFLQPHPLKSEVLLFPSGSQMNTLKLLTFWRKEPFDLCAEFTEDHGKQGFC